MTATKNEVVEIAALRLRIQTEPVSRAEALERAMDGCYTATICVQAGVMLNSTSSKTVIRDFLARSVVQGAMGHEIAYTPVAFSEGGAGLFVQVRVTLS